MDPVQAAEARSTGQAVAIQSATGHRPGVERARDIAGRAARDLRPERHSQLGGPARGGSG